MSNTIEWKVGDKYYIAVAGGTVWEVLKVTDREITIRSCATGQEIYKSRTEHDQHTREGVVIPMRGLSGERYRNCNSKPGYEFSYEIQRRVGDQITVKFFACGPNGGWKNDNVRDLQWSAELESIKDSELQPLEVSNVFVSNIHNGSTELCTCDWDQLYRDGTHSNSNCRDRV